MTLKTPSVLASGSKWPAATALLKMIDHAKADLDAPMSRYLSWWTTNSSDPRSRATMRHFLSMTSGMVTDGDDMNAQFLNDSSIRKAYSQNGMPVYFACTETSNIACMQKVYDASPALFVPGEYFSYGSLSFNFVAAAMEAIYQKNIGDLLDEYFLRPLNFTGKWWPHEKPLLGGTLVASADDMDKFNLAMLRREFLSPVLHNEQEHITLQYDQYSTSNLVTGPYGLGVWADCDRMGPQPWPLECQLARRFTHMGCNGYWNYVNRRDGYYYNFLPMYTCDTHNNWCGGGSADAHCPAMGPAGHLRQEMDTYIADAMRVYSADVNAVRVITTLV